MPIFKNSTQLFMKKIQITFTNLRKASPTQYIWHGLCNTVSEKPYVIFATDNRFLLQSLDSSSPITRRGPPCHTLFLSNKRKEKSNSFRLMRRKRSRFDSNSHNQPKFSYFDEICSNPIQQKQEVIQATKRHAYTHTVWHRKGEASESYTYSGTGMCVTFCTEGGGGRCMVQIYDTWSGNGYHKYKVQTLFLPVYSPPPPLPWKKFSFSIQNILHHSERFWVHADQTEENSPKVSKLIIC